MGWCACAAAELCCVVLYGERVLFLLLRSPLRAHSFPYALRTHSGFPFHRRQFLHLLLFLDCSCVSAAERGNAARSSLHCYAAQAPKLFLITLRLLMI